MLKTYKMGCKEKKDCKCKKPCNEDLLGCIHYHSTDCITGNGIIGNQPNGTSVTNILKNFWTYFQDNLAEDGVSVTGAAVNGSGNLIITLSDGNTINAGYVKGADGTNGTNGTNGADGTDGSDGINGVDGLNGIDGLDGANGVDGADASAVLYYNYNELKTTSVNTWVTVATYVLPSGTLQEGDYLNIDIVLSSNDITGSYYSFADLFRINHGATSNIQANLPWTANDELLAMHKNQNGIDEGNYNLNIKIYKRAVNDSPLFNVFFYKRCKLTYNISRQNT